MPEPILCPQCDHDIDAHDDGLSQRCYPEGVSYCPCTLAPSDIAYELLTTEPTEAEVEAAARAIWSVGLPGLTNRLSKEAARRALRAARGLS